MSRNEVLSDYYFTVQEGLNSIFTQAKITYGHRFKIDGSTAVTSGLQFAGELIPEVGGILKAVGAAMEWKNEKDIEKKLK